MVYIVVPAYPPLAPPVETSPSPEWTSSLLPISPSPSVVPSPVSLPMIPLTELLPALFKRYDRDIGELFTRSRAVRDEIFSQRYQFRSLEHEQERTTVTFRALWRHVLALEAWQTALQRELHEMRGRVTVLEQERDRRERKFGNAKPDRLVVTSRTGSYPNT
nr:hypothetical protein [Tanacetum cinerariifolium]